MNIQTYLKKHRVTQKEFAKKIGATQGFVSQLLLGKRPIPAEKVLPIELATNGQVSRHELRPDIYPPEEQHKSA